MNWFIFALLSTLFYAVAEIIVKYISDKKSEPIYLSIIGACYSGITGMVLAFTQHQIIFYFTPKIILLILTSSLLGSIGVITYYAAIKCSDISEFVLFTRTQVLFLFLGGILLYRETFTSVQSIGIALVLIGAIAISMSKTKIHLNKGSILALVTALLFGSSILIDRSIIQNFSSSFYTGMTYLLMATMLLIPTIIAVKNKRKLPQKKTWGLLLITSSLYALSTMFTYNSYKAGGYVSLTTLIAQLQIPIIVLYGIFVFKEKDRMIQKVFAMVCMVVGAYLLHG